MKNLREKFFILLVGIIAGLILSLWWQTAQREHREEMEVQFEQAK